MKTKKHRFYILSLMLIVSGMILLFTDIYSKGPVETDVVTSNSQNQTQYYPWDNSGPEYILKSNTDYEFCKSEYCWSFDTSIMEPANDGFAYRISGKYKNIPKITLGNEIGNFSLSYVNSDVFLCADMGCWLIQEGINNLLSYNQFANSSGKSTVEFLKFVPIVE